MEKENVVLKYNFWESEDITKQELIIQIFSGYGENDFMSLFLETQNRIVVYNFLHDSPSLRMRIKMEEADMFCIRIINSDFVWAGGIWQMNWFDDEQRYTLYEVCSSFIDMIEDMELSLETD